MPTYEYKCNACKKRLEIFQSIKEEPRRKCPECGKAALERLIGTGGAIIFKGSGFYQTDYRSESYKKAAESDKPAEAASDKPSGDKAGATAETKPTDSPGKTGAGASAAPPAESKPGPKSSTTSRKKSKSKA